MLVVSFICGLFPENDYLVVVRVLVCERLSRFSCLMFFGSSGSLLSGMNATRVRVFWWWGCVSLRCISVGGRYFYWLQTSFLGGINLGTGF